MNPVYRLIVAISICSCSAWALAASPDMPQISPEDTGDIPRSVATPASSQPEEMSHIKLSRAERVKAKAAAPKPLVRAYPGVPSLDTFPLEKQASVKPVVARGSLGKNGPSFGLREDGGVSLGAGVSAPVSTPAFPSGFLVRDAMAEGPMTPVAIKPDEEKSGDSFARQEGEIPGLDLRFKASYAETSQGIAVTGEVEDLSGKDRAISVYYAVPVPKRSLRWWDDARSSRPVTRDEDYLCSKTLEAGAIGAHSFYPLCAVSGPGAGYSLSIPLDRPVLYRLAYSPSTENLFVAFDFALTKAASRFPGKAQFAFTIAAIDPAWGFRSALQRYYAAFPKFFTKVVKQEGLWAYHDATKLERPEDFGIMYHEMNGVRDYLDKQIAIDDKLQEFSFLYTSPEPYNLDLKAGDSRDYETLLKRWHEQESRADLIGQRAKVQEICGITDEDGRFWHQFVKLAWVSGARMVQNPDPDLPKNKEGVNRALLNYDPQDKAKWFTGGGVVGNAGKGLDGIYLDSIGVFTNDLDFQRDHFATSKFPLTFSMKSKKPCLPEEWSMAQFCQWQMEDLHRRGKMLMGNYYPKTFAFLMPSIDVCGTEGAWDSSDSDMNYWRAMSYQKPYLILAHGDFMKLTHEKIENDFRRNVFYGIYPSFFNGPHVDESGKKVGLRYFEVPALYNRDRELFKKYVPLIRRVNTTGWQPLTAARSNDPQVWVERYGSVDAGNLLITVLNTGAETKKVNLALEPSLGLSEKVRVKELSAGTPVSVKNNGTALEFNLDKSDVAVLSFDQR